MTDFAVTGKKRSGKGLFCAGIIRDAVREGRRVATNMDIHLEVMVGPYHKGTIVRLPDTPTVEDMNALGLGYGVEGDPIDEDRNGVIVLDECSAFFNARAWGDKTRQPLLDWLIHSGKLRWDVYYQMQGLEQVDKQLRATQIEYHISVKRTDRWPIPGVTWLSKLVGLDIRFPKMHVGIIKHGCDRESLVVDRKWYRAKELYAAYDTEQRFLGRDHPDACGLHSVLSNWHVRGRFLGARSPFWLRWVRGIFGQDPWALRAIPEARAKHPVAVVLQGFPERARIRMFRNLDAGGVFDL
ncbi:MAG: hypothetical protein J0M01_01595 [Dechloromonas sp.]|jgi:hypothetical protein|nr:hypothetical protein [Dechloromonas sp.]